MSERNEMNRLIVHGEEAMTVGELIARLQQFPMDTPVVFRECSDYSALKSDQVGFSPAIEKQFFVRNNGVLYYQPYYSGQVKDEEFVSVVTFPGN